MVLYQLGTHDLRNTQTEVLKQHFIEFSDFLKTKSIQLFISGPVPSYGLTSELFSRLVAIDNWLLEWAEAGNILYVSNFNLFWKKRHLFHRGGTLNKTGALFLTDNIKPIVHNLISS